jgi:L-seryl-tRNA(Ser) seleniumtransferase
MSRPVDESESGARAIPSIDRLRQRSRVRALEKRHGADPTLDALRTEASRLRERLASADSAIMTPDEAARAIEDAAARRLASSQRPTLHPVINATGVIIHTNLGRAPLSRAAAARVGELAARYTNLEYDTAEGARGSRNAHAEPLLARLTGAEAAVVVNNNAAATLIALAALANGREVVISRGELVEIGGGFRIPDVMAQSGAVLREVGTTNRTRVADYAAAVSDRTAMLLRVHPSNFRIEGFTERPTLASLVDLGRRLGVPVCEDLGSGNLVTDAHGHAFGSEPSVQASVEAGADLAWFSGDKMLGGPQAGIIVGRRTLVDDIRRHPLMRALRVDKMTYAALEATLLEHLRGEATIAVPVVRMIAMTSGEVERRALALTAALDGTGIEARIIDGASTIGGGSAPGASLPTRLVELHRPGWSADRLEAALRSLDTPIIARIDRDRVVLDLRTVLPDEDHEIASRLSRLPGESSKTG